LHDNLLTPMPSKMFMSFFLQWKKYVVVVVVVFYKMTNRFAR